MIIIQKTHIETQIISATGDKFKMARTNKGRIDQKDPNKELSPGPKRSGKAGRPKRIIQCDDESQKCQLTTPERKAQTKTGNFLSSLGLKVVNPMTNSTATGDGRKVSRLKCVILKHIDSWAMVIRIDGYNWCDKIFSDDVKLKKDYIKDFDFEQNRYLWYHNNIKMLVDPAKQYGIRLYGVMFGTKPSRKDALAIGNAICDGFNLQEAEHKLIMEEESFFWLKTVKNPRWCDIIGDVSALYLLKSMRKTDNKGA